MYPFFHLHFLYPFIFLPKEKKTKHKKGRHLIGTLRQITLLGIKMYHMMSKQIREGYLYQSQTIVCFPQEGFKNETYTIYNCFFPSQTFYPSTILVSRRLYNFRNKIDLESSMHTVNLFRLIVCSILNAKNCNLFFSLMIPIMDYYFKPSILAATISISIRSSRRP